VIRWTTCVCLAVAGFYFVNLWVFHAWATGLRSGYQKQWHRDWSYGSAITALGCFTLSILVARWLRPLANKSSKAHL
jgi:hypothetical protein